MYPPRISYVMTALLALAVLLLVGCSSPTPVPAPTSVPASSLPAAGQPVVSSNPAYVTVRELIDNGAKYEGQLISLKGKIVLECPEGCWFFLDDGTGKIYVDLKPAGLTIPQKVGSQITLRGKTKGVGGNLQVLGEQVSFEDDK